MGAKGPVEAVWEGKEILHCVQDDNWGVFVVFVRDTVGAVLSRL